MKQRLFCLITAAACAVAAAPRAEAATLPSVDFRPGQTIGIGLAGLAYDYAFPRVSLGASLGTSNFANFNNSRLNLGTRAVVRFLEQPSLSAGVVGGLLFDPGVPGGRSFLVPDVGLGVAYRFNVGQFPLALRFNVTVTAEQGQSTPYYQPVPTDPGIYVPPRGNLLQRLTMGPNTMVALAYMPSDNLEVTLGGGTLVGVRFSY